MAQHGTNAEIILDVMENVLAVIAREVAVHGRPLADVAGNLEAAIRLQEQAVADERWDVQARDIGFGVCPDCGYGYGNADQTRCGERTGS